MIIDRTDQVDQRSDRPTDHYLTEAEAVEAYGLSREAIRSRRRRGTIPATKTDTGWHYAPPTDWTGQTNRNDQTDRIVDRAELALAVEELHARVASLESQLGVKDTQIGELHRLLAQTALNAAPAKPWWKFW